MAQSYKKEQIALTIIAIIGIITSIYLTMGHFSSEESVCDINDTISCSTVNTSIYSYMLEIPVAILGIVWNIMLLALTIPLNKKPKIYRKALLGWFLAGFGFVIYLVIAEILLRAICPFCTLLHVLIIIGLIISFKMYYKQEHVSCKELFKEVKWHSIILILVILVLWLGFNWRYF